MENETIFLNKNGEAMSLNDFHNLPEVKKLKNLDQQLSYLQKRKQDRINLLLRDFKGDNNLDLIKVFISSIFDYYFNIFHNDKNLDFNEISDQRFLAIYNESIRKVAKARISNANIQLGWNESFDEEERIEAELQTLGESYISKMRKVLNSKKIISNQILLINKEITEIMQEINSYLS
jgi:hypothetical protein